MKKLLSLTGVCFFSLILYAQNIIQAGKGSYAASVPEATAYEDGYFAHPAAWFQQAWPELNLHDNARNKPLPTNDWWTEFLFRGLGRQQSEVHEPPVTVTTNGDRFGSEAWAYPHMVKASESGFDVFFPKGFVAGATDGRMVVGNPLKINATMQLQSNDENILFADFEVDTWTKTGWTATNNANNIQGPVHTSQVTQTPSPTGYTGDYFVNTFAGDAPRITLTSPKFTIQKKYIKLRVGGGNSPDTYVGLFINNEQVRNETGDNGPEITQRTWDVTEYIGRQAEIRIVDNSGGGWGFIMCDDIIFTDSQLGGAGYTADFQTTAAKVYDWSDLGFTLRSENNGKYMDATIIHGVPFVYAEMNGLYPILVPGGSAAVYNVNGRQITEFPAAIDAFTIEYGDRVYGVHAPLGSKVHQSKGGDFQIETPADKRYVVISVLPGRSFLGTYDQYARNKPRDIYFVPEYKVEEGKVVTTFNMNTKNMETGATNQPTLMSFLPHHWRNTTKNFSFINGADYLILKGLMHTGAATSFELAYNFGGMPPYLPEPLNMIPERKNTLNDLLTRYAADASGRNGNSYAKGFGEKTTGMLMAKAMDHPAFDAFRDAMKNELADWLTFDESEKTEKAYYFAKYPGYGALIGFPPGYGSQGFNDLHFHNGYFTVGAARLMMVDKEFKRDYAEIVKLITKTYANWDRYTGADDGTANYQPYLRTFDPYLGHSLAGGIGDGGGNNQESTSEAINSWFGVYLLGVELNDKKIIDVGATGYMLENLATSEYWLDVYEENFPSNYPHEYVGILRTDAMAWGTYFAGDPAWVLGIQACPTDFFYRGFMVNPEKMEQIQNEMFRERTTFIYDGQPMHTNPDPYDNIRTMGGYLGGYHLNILNNIDPERSAEFIERLCNEDPGWTNNYDLNNKSANYYLSNAMITYGKPAEGYHTSIPSGAVYQNEKGELAYLLYNATNEEVDVKIYKDGAVIKTIKVGAGKYYNSKAVSSKPGVTITTHKEDDKMAANKKVKVAAGASDKDGKVLWVDFYFDGELVGTSYLSPYEISFTPTGTGIKELKAIAFDDDGLESDPAVVSIEMIGEQTPFTGTPWNIPQQTIYAVQFDEGGPKVACHDNEIDMQGGDNYRPGTGVETEGTGNLSNSNIGWTNTGEWFEYTVNVQTAGVYSMSARFSSAGGGALRIFFDGVDMTGPVEFVSTGSWGDFEDVPVGNIPLKEGKQIMRVMIDGTGANLRSYAFTLLPGELLPSEVDAGEDLTISYPENSVTLNVTVKTYGDATITKYEWIQADSNTPAIIATPGQAETLVTGLEPGTYIFEVKITDSNDAVATDQVIVLVKPVFQPPTAIREVDNGSNIVIYPNPFVDRLFINLGENNEFKRLRLHSVTGKVVMEENIQHQSVVDLNTSTLARGHYILTLFSDKEVVSRKIIK